MQHDFILSSYTTFICIQTVPQPGLCPVHTKQFPGCLSTRHCQYCHHVLIHLHCMPYTVVERYKWHMLSIIRPISIPLHSCNRRLPPPRGEGRSSQVVHRGLIANPYDTDQRLTAVTINNLGNPVLPDLLLLPGHRSARSSRAASAASCPRPCPCPCPPRILMAGGPEASSGC